MFHGHRPARSQPPGSLVTPEGCNFPVTVLGKVSPGTGLRGRRHPLGARPRQHRVMSLSAVLFSSSPPSHGQVPGESPFDTKTGKEVQRRWAHSGMECPVSCRVSVQGHGSPRHSSPPPFLGTRAGPLACGQKSISAQPTLAQAVLSRRPFPFLCSTLDLPQALSRWPLRLPCALPAPGGTVAATLLTSTAPPAKRGPRRTGAQGVCEGGE